MGLIWCLMAIPAQGAVFNGPSSPGWTAGIPGHSFTSQNPNDITVAIMSTAIGPLTYSSLPEYDSAYSISATCLTAILGEKVRRRRRFRGRI